MCDDQSSSEDEAFSSHVQLNFLEPVQQGEKLEFTDDEEQLTSYESAKNVRRPPNGRRVEIASRRSLSSILARVEEKGRSAVVVPLNWRLVKELIGCFDVMPIKDASGIDYAIGGNPGKTDPEKGLNMGCAEITGLVRVAHDLCDIVDNDVKDIVILDPWGDNYAPFLAHVVQTCYKTRKRKGNSLITGIRKPKADKLKQALKVLQTCTSEALMLNKIREFYNMNF